jgi:hypothetical protein
VQDNWNTRFSQFSDDHVAFCILHHATPHPKSTEWVITMATDYPPSLPVVGDRVEVLREGKLCPAEVAKCHILVEYDVMYEKDGTGGTLVTREEHRLLEKGGRGKAAVQKKPAGPKKKRVCTIEGCTKQVKVRGACILHGAFGMCLIGDCTTMAVNKSQRCNKHGAKGLCTVPGCTTNAKNRGLCHKHGGSTMGVCVHPSCTTKANARGLCILHGAYGMCLIGDCTTMAVNKTQRCFKHGANGLCTVPGCVTNTKKRGLCWTHGGGSQAVCVHPGCTTKAKARGLCVKHGGCTKSVCVHPGCTTKAQARGFCTKHDGRSVCVHPGY